MRMRCICLHQKFFLNITRFYLNNEVYHVKIMYLYAVDGIKNCTYFAVCHFVCKCPHSKTMGQKRLLDEFLFKSNLL